MRIRAGLTHYAVVGTARDRFRYDAAIKDLFQTDHPSLLDQWTGGLAVRESLNVEFALVQERVADLVLLLEDDSILHVDFQSTNHPKMANRVGIYGLMINEKYERKVRQIVLYTGRPRLTMEDRLDAGVVTVRYELMDIREIDARTLIASGRPADYALALLASGGVERMSEIIAAASQLDEHHRRRALTQMAILSGLRGASEKLRMELKRMSLEIDIDTHAFLREIRDDAMAKGKAEGKAEGMAAVVRGLLSARFGAVPEWASLRIDRASPDQLLSLTNNILRAETVESLFEDLR